MRDALRDLPRYIATPTVSKHRIFAWLGGSILPDHQLIVFARDDDYTLGVLHSHPHELWARAKGTQLREVGSGFRYTPTTTFETLHSPNLRSRPRRLSRRLRLLLMISVEDGSTRRVPMRRRFADAP